MVSTQTIAQEGAHLIMDKRGGQRYPELIYWPPKRRSLYVFQNHESLRDLWLGENCDGRRDKIRPLTLEYPKFLPTPSFLNENLVSWASPSCLSLPQDFVSHDHV